MVNFPKPLAFDWDQGNREKSLRKHAVDVLECEEAFHDNERVVFRDERHSHREDRYILLGQAKNRRLLYVVFTLRNQGTLVRVISARSVNKKENPLYEKTSTQK